MVGRKDAQIWTSKVNQAGTPEIALPTASQFIVDSIDDATSFWAKHGGSEHHLKLGRARIILRLIGSAIGETVLPTLRHALADPDAASDAVIYAIDSQNTGFAGPPQDWPFETLSDQGRQRVHWTGPDGLALSSDESRGIWHLYDGAKQTGLYWIRAAQDLPFWEAASPLRHHIHWVSLQKDQGMLHAAVIAKGEAGAMLVGRGGSGKSTMTAAAMRQGWRSTGDDFVLVTNQPEPVSYPLYDMIKLSGMAENMFAEITASALNPQRRSDEKMLARMSDHANGAFVEALPIKAAFALTLTGKPQSRIGRTSSFQIVSAVAASSSVILRTGLKETFAFTSDMVRKLPCFRFEVGNDPLEALDVLDNFMGEI
ncbi:MAG: hypothetical protein AAF940_11790 [Pseudomonadota bacterium]